MIVISILFSSHYSSLRHFGSLLMKLVHCNMYFLNIHSALSRWCISHQNRAKEIVEIWEKLFNASQKEQRVSFLYLANDILQNSRRKGSEFVNEFWKVLPAALKRVYESGDGHGRKAVTRLVSLIFTCYKFCESRVLQSQFLAMFFGVRIIFSFLRVYL